MVQDTFDIRRTALDVLSRCGAGLAVAFVCLTPLAASAQAVGSQPVPSQPVLAQSVQRPAEATAAPVAEVGAADVDARCRVGAERMAFAPALPEARAEVAEQGRLTIVALGSSSTEGVGASAPEFTYPAMLKAELQRRLPGITVAVTNAGIGGQVTHDMWLRLDSVIARRPSLVIWQTGVNDAIRDVGTDKMAKILKRGVERLRDTDSDVVLMDLQWLPEPERYPRYGDYHAMLMEVAAGLDVAVFPRYAMMQAWAESDRFTRKDLVGGDGLHMADPSYHCIAVRLADGIVAALDGVKPPPLVSATPRRQPAH